ncbi:hypothetical protein C0W52_19235 [Photobacterium kishitanii]|uniref:HpcH/HpaI aldolase/citrate lyase domain-containing protein n=2 Tax=Photobacterium kishitanii TaxID=318456 RepID=A0AAX0YQ64_9GAMM|nr:hypothetical protein C0W59_15220 [Photobacterium kishitanii]PSW57653.1 hypothetical protein C0W54_21690 [Photobacterium kishitanii]PSX17389.1 hypothetical protein C0W70_20725 [Photobacterium kishitanii]PSX25780.1 hypothetical protein C0W39_22825 [Photobacterium kishitanii]PSX26343.1 hypothetical protein C0W52_19235 [Photobacterium kishitanii]
MERNIMKLGHSILFVPASDTAIVLNSFIYDVDAIMFDLEDCVALCEKDTAHLILFNA